MSAPRHGIPFVLGILVTLAILSLPGLPANAQLDTPVPQVTIPTVTAGGNSAGGVSGRAGQDGAAGLDGSLSAGAESERKTGNRARSNGVLSALIVLMLGLVVLVTAVVGARRSSR